MPIPLVCGGGFPQTLVLWDIDDCPVPDSLVVYTAWSNICSALYDKGYAQGRCEAIGFGDIFETKGNFGSAGISISHVDKGENDKRRNFILVKLLVKAINAAYHSNFVLLMGDISGHLGFMRALEHLKSRTSNRIILAQPGDVESHKLDDVVSSAWLWSKLSVKGDPYFHQTVTPRPRVGDDDEERYKTANTAIFWDVEYCPIPYGLDAGVVLQNIRSALAKRGIISIDEVVPVYAYGDTMHRFQGLETHDMVQYHLSPSDKDGRLEKILVDLLCCLIDKPYTTNLILIVGDISRHAEYIYAANLLKNINFNLFLAQPQIKSPALGVWPDYPGAVWRWSRLSSGKLPQVSLD